MTTAIDTTMPVAQTMRDRFTTGTTNGVVAARQNSVGLTSDGRWTWAAYKGDEQVAHGTADTYWEARWLSLEARVEQVIANATKLMQNDLDKEYIAEHVRDAVHAAIQTPKDGEDKSDWWLINRARGFAFAYSGHRMKAKAKHRELSLEWEDRDGSGLGENKRNETRFGDQVACTIDEDAVGLGVDLAEALKFLDDTDKEIIRLRLAGYEFTAIRRKLGLTAYEVRIRMGNARSIFDAAIRAE
jgi:hypothetical protein